MVCSILKYCWIINVLIGPETQLPVDGNPYTGHFIYLLDYEGGNLFKLETENP